jgi:hypothetical protein
MRNICVHVMNIGNYFPKLTELTLPTIERFAENINADLNVFTTRMVGGPILSEKLQVYYHGMRYDYNILLDLDMLIHPDCYNPFINNIPKTHCAFKDNYHADTQLESDIYFERDGRNIGISGCAIFTTNYTHDLWKFDRDWDPDEIIQNIKIERPIVDEYILSHNLAKYGLKYIEPYPVEKEYHLMFHLGAYDQDEQEMLDRAKLWYKTFWK